MLLYSDNLPKKSIQKYANIFDASILESKTITIKPMNTQFLKADEANFIETISLNQQLDLASNTLKKKSGTGARILEWLVRKAGKGTIKVSRIAIGNALGICERTVTRVMNEISRQGLIHVKRTYLGNKMNDLNEYQLSADFWRSIIANFATTTVGIVNMGFDLAKNQTKRLKALFGGRDKLSCNNINIELPHKNCTDSIQNDVDIWNDIGKHVEIPF